MFAGPSPPDTLWLESTGSPCTAMGRMAGCSARVTALRTNVAPQSSTGCATLARAQATRTGGGGDGFAWVLAHAPVDTCCEPNDDETCAHFG